MKKSLLLIGLTMFAGLAASAQAATATHHLHAQDSGANASADMLVAASGYDSSLLSALGDLISGNAQTTGDTSSTCRCRHDTQAAERKPATPPLPPGPATAAPMSGTAPIPADPSDTAAADRQPPAAPANGGGQVPAETRPDLGWQSLLPGSIQ